MPEKLRLEIGSPNHYCYNTGAVLYQLSCQAKWELVTTS